MYKKTKNYQLKGLKCISMCMFFFVFFCDPIFAVNEKSPELLEMSNISREDIVKFLYKDYLPILKADTGLKTATTKLYQEKRLSEDSNVFEAVVKVSLFLQERGNLSSCIEIINRVLPYYQKGLDEGVDKMSYYVCRLQIMLGAAYEEVGFWKQAMDLYKRTMLLAEKTKIEDLKAFLLNNMANVYFKQNDFVRAAKLYNQAIELNTKLNNKKELFNNYNNLAGLAMGQKKYEQALDYAFMALQQVNRKQDPYSYYVMLLNMSIIYLEEGKIEVAWEHIPEGLEYMKKNKYWIDYASNCLTAANVWKKKGDKKQEKHWLDNAEETLEKLHNNKLLGEVYKAKSDYYLRNNDYKQACLYLTSSQNLKDSISQLDSWKKLSEIEMVYEAEKYTQELSLVSRELQIKSLTLQKQRLIFLSIIMVCIIVIALIGYRFFIQKKNRRIKEELVVKQTELHVKEKEILMKRQSELQNELEIKSRELTSKVLSLVRNNEFVINITEELKQLLLKISPKENVKKEQIRELMTKLRIQSNNTTDSEFKYYFEQVYQSFYDNLLSFHPSLTQKDLRLCAFLRLGLSTKEIAAITFREVRSIDSARNRLRKKMNISTDADLVEFFSKF